MNSLFDNFKVAHLADNQLINSTTVEQTRYFDCKGMSTVLFTITQVTVSTQDLQNVKLVQATSSAGANKKAITGAALADAAFVNAAALQAFQIELDNIALDHEDDFRYVAVEASASAASTDLNITVSAIGRAAHKHRELTVGDESTDVVKVPAGGTHGS